MPFFWLFLDLSQKFGPFWAPHLPAFDFWDQQPPLPPYWAVTVLRGGGAAGKIRCNCSSFAGSRGILETYLQNIKCSPVHVDTKFKNERNSLINNWMPKHFPKHVFAKKGVFNKISRLILLSESFFQNLFWAYIKVITCINTFYLKLFLFLWSFDSFLTSRMQRSF